MVGRTIAYYFLFNSAQSSLHFLPYIPVSFLAMEMKNYKEVVAQT